MPRRVPRRGDVRSTLVNQGPASQFTREEGVGTLAFGGGMVRGSGLAQLSIEEDVKSNK